LIPHGFKTTGAFGVGGELAFQLTLDDSSTALVFCDMMMNTVHKTGFGKFLTVNTFTVARLIFWLAVATTAPFKAFLESIGTDSVKVVCVAHGPPIRENCGQKIRDIAKGL